MLVVSPSGVTAAAWVSAPDSGTDGRLYIAVGNMTPVELRDSMGPVLAHGEAPPKIAYRPDGSLYAVYVVGTTVPTSPYPRAALRMVRSPDGGKTWDAPVTVSTPAERGSRNFHALLIANDGTIFVSWLGADSGKSTSWLTHSSDGGVTWASRVRVDSGEACPCCRTALAAAPDGALYMAWRHVYPGNIRDVVVARSDDRGATWTDAIRVHADEWMFNGCPHAGPSLQVDSAGSVHIAWWTGKADAAGVWYARSTDRGQTFGTPVALGVAKASRPAHVQLALGKSGIVAAAWDDGTQTPAQVAFRLSRDGGNTFGPLESLSDARIAPGFPVMTLEDSTVTVAWSEQAPAAEAAKAERNARDPHAHRQLEAVGGTQVLVRRGVVTK